MIAIVHEFHNCHSFHEKVATIIINTLFIGIDTPVGFSNVTNVTTHAVVFSQQQTSQHHHQHQRQTPNNDKRRRVVFTLERQTSRCHNVWSYDVVSCFVLVHLL